MYLIKACRDRIIAICSPIEFVQCIPTYNLLKSLMFILFSEDTFHEISQYDRSLHNSSDHDVVFERKKVRRGPLRAGNHSPTPSQHKSH